ncbi:hypothetical protein GDO86_003138 [Hymenochirus boettgeri]|uniref:Uncharacterized protein n=1 Tax=Hymenochirus boettgeri TaxID=247094 RepID=A0A8T2K2Y4_9PIPI|nr:hypothetical protein GDO86_003138 [Hymenochirus boettgeri]
MFICNYIVFYNFAKDENMYRMSNRGLLVKVFPSFVSQWKGNLCNNYVLPVIDKNVNIYDKCYWLDERCHFALIGVLLFFFFLN